MLSKIPIDLDSEDEDEIDKQILRAALVSELDACNLYEQMAAYTDNDNVKTILTDILKEEKTHIGEFLAVLKEIDYEQKNEIEEGENEVDKITEGSQNG